MTRAICVFVLALMLFGCDRAAPELEEVAESESGASDLTCGTGALRVSHAGGTFLNPESCVWLPVRGLFACSQTAYPYGGTRVADYVGWISFFDSAGNPWFTGGGYGGPTGWSVDNEWTRQCGAGYLSNPLGITTGKSPDGDDRIYVVEAGVADGKQSVWAFDIVVDPDDPAMETCAPVNVAQLSTRTANDIARLPDGSLLVSESAFGAPDQSAILKVSGMDGAGIPTVSQWLSLAQYPAPNPIKYAVHEGSPYLFVATLGTNLDPTSTQPHNGRILRIPITPTGAAGPVTAFGPQGFYDGLTYRRGIVGGVLLVSDLKTRRVQTVHPLTGSSSLWLDVSAELPQTGGIACDGGVTSFTCAISGFRNSQVLVATR
jgi:hypothetical protein